MNLEGLFESTVIFFELVKDDSYLLKLSTSSIEDRMDNILDQKMGSEEYYVNRIILALTEDFVSSLNLSYSHILEERA